VRWQGSRKPIYCFALALGLVTSVAASELEFEFLAEAILPGDLEVGGTLVGGLSGLTYDSACDLFYALSDDRGQFAPARFFTLRIGLNGGTPEVEVVEVTFLRDRNGEVFERGGLDPEALVLSPEGTLYLSSEGVPHRGVPPFIRRVALDGSTTGDFSLPEHFLPHVNGGRGVRDNLGFEGLGLTADGALLFAAAENALLQDGPAADLDVGSPTRLLVLETSSGRPVAEYLYRVDPVPEEPRPAGAFRTNGISEILALDAHRLLVVERSFSAGVGNRVRLFLADLEGADDILGRDRLAGAGDPKPRAVSKRLIVDLRDLGIEADNIEGVALGPQLADGRRLLVMVSDNNFQPSVQSNQVLFFAVSGMQLPVVRRPSPSISEVQGPGHISPLVGRCVSDVAGVVTAVLGSRKGQAFWVQDPVGDGDLATSDGVLVTVPEGLPQVMPGDALRLDGRVEERCWREELPVTRLVASAVEIEERGRELPTPVTLGRGGRVIPRAEVASPGLHAFDPARYAADAFESLEGMRVRVAEGVVVGPTSSHGEVVVLADGGCGAGPRTARGGIARGDAGPSPERIVIDDRLVSGPPALKVGDVLEDAVEGILHYTFGAYKILNSSPLPAVTPGGLDHEITPLEGGPARLTVATFNLENVSALSPEEKFERLGRVVAAHLRSPDILAVQEVQDDTGPEDDGTVSAAETLARLVEAIEAAGGVRYDVRSIDPADGGDGGRPGANIRTAFLFNPVRVDFVDRISSAEARDAEVLVGSGLGPSPGLVASGNPAFTVREDGRGGSRKPLAGEFVFAGRRLSVVNLHLVSKGGDDPLFGRRQPPRATSSTRREDQAQAVSASVSRLLKEDPESRVIVLGDLNDFEDSPPLRAFEAAGLEDLVKRLPVDDRYTYVYLGTSQVLDHILVSPNLAGGAEVDAVHLAAEFPAAERASDHDPVIVRLAF